MKNQDSCNPTIPLDTPRPVYHREITTTSPSAQALFDQGEAQGPFPNLTTATTATATTTDNATVSTVTTIITITCMT